MKVSNEVAKPLWEYFPDRVLPLACPSRVVLDHVTSKWGVLILVALSEETLRWGELRRRAQGISEKMLAQTLRTLERDGLVHRDAQPVSRLASTTASPPAAASSRLFSCRWWSGRWPTPRTSSAPADRARASSRPCRRDPRQLPRLRDEAVVRVPHLGVLLEVTVGEVAR